MNISYRTRKRLTGLGITALVVAIVAVVLWVCWMIWVSRYMVYHRDGPRLEFDLPENTATGVIAQPPVEKEPVKVVYDEPEIDVPVVEVVPTGITGYYIDLEQDTAQIMEQLDKLDKGTAVLLDVKNTRGEFFFTSKVSDKHPKEMDIEQMDQLMDYLLSSDLYLIARLPAFRDYHFGLNNVSCGLPRKGGNGSLWLDDTNCYWLDPTKDGTLEYLSQQVMELRLKGFDEVVFTDFRFPYTEKIEFEGDQAQAISDASTTLVERLTTDGFFVSFQSEEVTFPLPTGNSRLYLADIPAAEVATIVEQVLIPDPSLHLLFLTTVNDTRFDEYCVLRPLENAY